MRRFLCSMLALAAIASAAPQQRDDVREHFERGLAAYLAHDDSGESAAEAEIEFRRALQRDPRFAAAIAYLGFLAAERQQLKEAETAYRRALEIDSRCAEARVGIARLDQQAGRRAEALHEMRRAIAENPEHPLALNELAVALTIETANPTPEMWEEAVRCWLVLVRLNPDARSAHQGLAEAYERQSHWADAERHYREVLRIGQTDEDSDLWVYAVHKEVARLLERQGKFHDAIGEYEALIASEDVGENEIKEAKSRIEALQKRLPR
jgi:tetratricopeptide (TPR) repeat protein